MKRWLANLFIVILLLSLTGCISYKENNRETERDTIVISVLAGQSTSDAGVEDMIDEWMEKNFPQVYLEWECVDWGDQFNTQMKSRIAAGEIPDIIIGKAQDVQIYAKAGNLAKISDSYLGKIQKDALKEAGEAPELYQTAEKNLQSAIEVLLSPILKTAGYTLMWE